MTHRRSRWLAALAAVACGGTVTALDGGELPAASRRPATRPAARSQASLHLGNSLTDSIDGYLPPIAAAGGFPLRFERYTVPGIGTWIYDEMPTGGSWTNHAAGADVQAFVRGTALDHLSMQPYPNMPCVPSGREAGTPARNRSDAVNVEQVWNDQASRNPDVQLWLFAGWQGSPADSSSWGSCITKGGWVPEWSPPAPTTWEKAQLNQLGYVERVRAALVTKHPSRPPPFVVPAPRALTRLRAAVESGRFPGVAADAFSSTFFLNGGVRDDHLTPVGRYYVALVFYACMFQADPRALPDTSLGTPAAVTPAQASALQQLAWDTVRSYPLSGFGR